MADLAGERRAQRHRARGDDAADAHLRSKVGAGTACFGSGAQKPGVLGWCAAARGPVTTRERWLGVRCQRCRGQVVRDVESIEASEVSLTDKQSQKVAMRTKVDAMRTKMFSECHGRTLLRPCTRVIERFNSWCTHSSAD